MLFCHNRALFDFFFLFLLLIPAINLSITNNRKPEVRSAYWLFYMFYFFIFINLFMFYIIIFILYFFFIFNKSFFNLFQPFQHYLSFYVDSSILPVLAR